MAKKQLPLFETEVKKRCTKCGELKGLDGFCKDKTTQDGFCRQCKECRKKNWSDYYENNKEDLRKKYIRYYNSHSEQKRAYRKRTRFAHKIAVKKWTEKNAERIKQTSDAYFENNKDQIYERAREKYHSILKFDAKYQLKRRMAKGIRRTLMDGKQGRQWEEFVDYDVHSLVKHLKKNMPEGYTWKDFKENPSLFHIDHIIPVDVFNFDAPDQIDFKKCWSLKNLQLLPARENISKGNRIDAPFQPSLNLSFGQA